MLLLFERRRALVKLKFWSMASSPALPLVIYVSGGRYVYFNTPKMVKVKLVLDIPVGPTATVLLGLLRVSVGKAVLAEPLRHVLLGKHGAFGHASVVLVVELVGARHYKPRGDISHP